jgi:hypothetical protein
MRTKPTNNSTSIGSREGFRMGLPRQRQRFYRECSKNTWALCRGQLHLPLAVAVPQPLFASDKREVSLVGRNCGIQQCDFVDSLSLVIKCLGGGVQVGGLGSPDYRQTTLSLWRPSQHTHTPLAATTTTDSLLGLRRSAWLMSLG